MRIGEGDQVVTVARTEHSDEEPTEKPEEETEELSDEELAAMQAADAEPDEVATDDDEE